jgi:beta-lysine N6-acetyltransferase
LRREEGDAIHSSESLSLDARALLHRLAGGSAPDLSKVHTGRWHAAHIERPHGGELVLDPHNGRVKLYDARAEDTRDPGFALWKEGLRTCADLYTKLIVYARPGRDMSWITAGYLYEGFIAGFFPDGEAAELWVAFGDDLRAEAPRDEQHNKTVQIAAAKEIVRPTAVAGCTSRPATAHHAASIAELMLATFEDYPTPISTEIIREQIESGSNLFRTMIDQDGEIVASASAEIDHERRVAEMTDCATRPDQRGAGHMACLLEDLAGDLQRELGITDLYTLARADEIGMNCVFGKLGYDYTGRLVNNCRMPNGWESMNIWCRSTAAV